MRALDDSASLNKAIGGLHEITTLEAAELALTEAQDMREKLLLERLRETILEEAPEPLPPEDNLETLDIEGCDRCPFSKGLRLGQQGQVGVTCGLSPAALIYEAVRKAPGECPLRTGIKVKLKVRQ